MFSNAVAVVVGLNWYRAQEPVEQTKVDGLRISTKRAERTKHCVRWMLDGDRVSRRREIGNRDRVGISYGSQRLAITDIKNGHPDRRRSAIVNAKNRVHPVG